jgi:hypothetical protein
MPKTDGSIWPMAEVAVLVVGFVAFLTLLDKHDGRLKRHRERADRDGPTDQRPSAPARDPHPEHKHPTEEQHRSNAEAHWRKQILIEGIALGLSAIAAGAAITAGIGAWYTYDQTNLAVVEAGRQTTEVRRQANAAEGALKLTRDNSIAEDRPYVWLSADLGQPQLIQNRSGGYQVVWNFRFENYGKTPALKVKDRSWTKTDGKTFVPSLTDPDAPKQNVTGMPLAPTGSAYNTAVSAPGLTPDEFNGDVTKDRFIGIKGTITYTDSSGGEYVSDFCLERLGGGAISYCLEDNDIK